MIQELKALGCDMDRVMVRFMGDQVFYEECYRKFVEIGQIEYLGELLAEGDVQEAFAVAHTLKGTLSNLGLTPLLDIIVVIVEALRRNIIEGVQEDYDKLLEKWCVFKNLV